MSNGKTTFQDLITFVEGETGKTVRTLVGFNNPQLNGVCNVGEFDFDVLVEDCMLTKNTFAHIIFE